MPLGPEILGSLPWPGLRAGPAEVGRLREWVALAARAPGRRGVLSAAPVWRTGAGGPRGLVRLRGRIRGGPSGPSSAGLPGRAGKGGGRLSPKRHSPRPVGSGDLLAQAAICGGQRNPAGRQNPGCSSQRKLRAAALARFVLQTNLCRPDTRLLWYPPPRYLLPVVDKLRRAVLESKNIIFNLCCHSVAT